MNAKQVVIAMLLVGGAAVLFRGREDEPAPPVEPAPHPAPRQQAPLAPHPAARPGSQPGSQRERESESTGTPWVQDPYAVPYRTAPWAGTEDDAYRFRPLNERDQRRMAIPESPPLQSRPPRTATPQVPYGPWGRGEYRFRPFAPKEGTDGRYEAPYQTPDWGPEPDYADQWDLPPARQPVPPPRPSWEPPARRMLPSLDWSSNRTFTAR